MMAVNADLAALVRTIPDHPQPGIQFRDISTLLLDGEGFRATIDRLAAVVEGEKFDLIAGLEARGFIIASALSYVLRLGKVMLRKQGKLPGKRVGIDYTLEYGTDRLEMHEDAVRTGQRILLVDDLIATGGTALAAIELLRGCGAEVDTALFVMDLPDLGGAERLRSVGVQPHCLIEFAGD